MAYNNSGNNGRSFGGNRQAQQGQGNSFRRGDSAPAAKGEYKEDPSKVGIGYERQTKSGSTYIALTLTKEVPVGTKLSVFPNDKVKNRTDKTPTHIVKIATARKSA